MPPLKSFYNGWLAFLGEAWTIRETINRVANGSGIHWIPWIVLDFFWYWKCTWKNVLEKSHFFSLVLEFFLNSEFLTSDFLGYNISGCPLFGSPICEKILFQFCPIICSWKMWKCSWNVLELFWNFFTNSVGHPDQYFPFVVINDHKIWVFHALIYVA